MERGPRQRHHLLNACLGIVHNDEAVLSNGEEPAEVPIKIIGILQEPGVPIVAPSQLATGLNQQSGLAGSPRAGLQPQRDRRRVRNGPVQNSLE